jgi:pyridoxamine 5'-phosphate oxidase
MEKQERPISEMPTILNEDPYVEFQKWFDLAGASGSLDFDAMVLATASKSGVPHARTVLFKGIKDGAIKFYTNYKSAKGRELAANPRAALVMYWSALYRQVRIEGVVKKMSRKESLQYFKSRPRESQLGALASMQSQKVKSFEALDKKFEELEKKYMGKEIECPTYWGGYFFIPNKFEFWMGRTRRLHHRVSYTKKNKTWKKTFLSP